MRNSLNLLRSALMAASALLLSWSEAAAQQSIYESFNYPLNANVAGQSGGTGWLAGSSWQLGGNSDGAVIVPGMTFSGTKNSLATQGNAVLLTDNGDYPYDDIIGRQIAPASALTSGTMWMSYLVYMPYVDDGGAYSLRVNSTVDGWWNSAQFQVASKAGNTVNPGISGFANPSNPPTNVANNPISPNQIYLVVAEYQGLATYSGTGQMWVLNTSNLDKLNFSSSSQTVASLNANNVSTATITGTYPEWLDASDFLQFSNQWYNGGTSAIKTALFDELRVGPSVNNVLVLNNVAGTWASNANGTWSSAGNWTGGLPNAPGNQATFASAITAPRTVTVDIPVTVGTLSFNNSNAYTLSGAQSITLLAGSGDAAISVANGSHAISVPLNLGSNTDVTVAASGSTLTLSGSISGAGFALNKLGAGLLVLTGSTTYTGGTTVTAGSLQGNASSLQGAIVNNAALIFNQAANGTYAGSMTGNGSLTKTGSGRLTLGGADTVSSSGSIAIAQGTLTAPFGFSHGGLPINVAGGATLEAAGQVKRAISGSGTVTATADLIIGDSSQTGQFNQGGAPGTGGTLNVGGKATTIYSADAAILGSQTNIDAGGSLTTLNGAQLGNPTSLDATKVLTATGSATINGNFINNGFVHGPSGGQQLKFTQFVKGAGGTTGNIEYAGSYSPGNSPAGLSVENVLFDPTNTLIMELGGLTPGSEYDQLDISGLAVLNGTLDVNLVDGFVPSAGETFNFFNGPTTGSFTQINLPPIGNGQSWDTSSLYTTGQITFVPEPSSLALLAAGLIGLVIRVRRRQLN